MDALRFPKKSCHKMDIVDIQIQQRSARLFRIKDRSDNSLLERIVTAGILRVVQLDDFHIAKAGKQLPYLFIIGIVLVRDSLKENQAFPFRQLRQFLCLRIGHSERLF